MNSLLYCYNKIKEVYPDLKEPFSSIETVDKYRKYWQPKNTKIILLAESHVFTSKKDNQILLNKILANYPSRYARFVYCLGYGEKSLLRARLGPKKDGTPEFWKIFYACISNIKSNNDFGPIKKTSTKNFDQRIQNKINLLKNLKAKGIWLVDASIVALYSNDAKPSKKIMRDVIKTSWEYYIFDILKKESPQKIIVIGKFVGSALKKQLKNLKIPVYIISQPNAHMSSKQRLADFKKYYKICNFKYKRNK